MTRRTLPPEGTIAESPQPDNADELRHLIDRLSTQDMIIGSLAPEQWLRIASRVPPGHREERTALAAIARLAEQLREKA